jgi:phosphatidate cytidylyltransferase
VAREGGGNLRLRVLSALVLLPIALGAALLGGWAFTALVALAAALMAYEWDRLCGGEGTGLLGAVGIGAALVALALAGAGLYLPALAAMGFGVLLAATVAALTRRAFPWPALGVVYVTLPCVVLVWLRAAPEGGRETIFWLFLLVWATDAGAYFVGRGIGGPRLAPRISPGKTWSGLAGGMVCGALAGAGFGLASGASRLGVLALLSALLAVFSQVGDLAESWLKRNFGVKDTGALIPGHGGVLDRVDGLLFATVGVGALTLAGGGWIAWP